MNQNTTEGASRAAIAWPKRSEAWWTACILILAFTIAYIDRQLLSLLVEPIRSDLNISDVQFSLLQGFAFAVFYSLMGLPIGRLADRADRRLIVAVAAALWSLMTALCGLARNFWMLFFARVGVGIGEGGLPSAAISLLSDYFPPERLSLPVGLFVAGTYIGGGLAFFLGGMLIDMIGNAGPFILPGFGEIKPWQMVFIIIGTPGILVALLACTIREPLRRGRLGESSIASSSNIQTTIEYIRTRWRFYVLFSLGVSLIAGFAAGSAGWLPAFFQRVYGWSIQTTGVVFGIMFLTSGVFGTVISSLADRYFESKGVTDSKIKIALVAIALMIPCALVGTQIPDHTLGAVIISCSMMLFAIPIALGPATLVVATPNEFRGQVTAIYLLFIAILGIGFGPVAIAMTTQFVFNNDVLVGKSLSLIGTIFGCLGFFLIRLSIPTYIKMLSERDKWKQ